MRLSKWFFVSCCLTLWLFSSGARAAPRVANRAAKSDEWGYRPADGSSTRLNPPSLTWVHEAEAQTYGVQWSTNGDFAGGMTVEGIPWPTYTHNKPLPPGKYYWRYRYQTRGGEASEWSVARSVTVPEDAVEFPMPTRLERWGRVPELHPRLFMRPEQVTRLRSFAKGSESKRFARLRQEADRILKAGPTPEPEHLGSARDKNNEELIKYWWPNRQQTMKACQEAELLAFVYLMTGDRLYGNAARKWVLHLASWDPDGPTNFRLNCEAGKPMLYRPARAYDWAWDMFTPGERARVQEMMKRRIRDAWESGEVRRGVGHLNRPYSSHGNRVFHKIGEAGIAFLGEIPEAEVWLDYAVNKFYACYPVWSGEDGGWHEGVSYWAGYIGKAVWWLQAAKVAMEIDGLKKPFFSQVGDYPLYVAPPGSPNIGFGDLSYRPPSTGWGGFMEYLIRAKGAQSDGEHAAYWRWWTQQWKMKEESGILGFLYQANLPPLPAAQPPLDLPVSKVFGGIGVASLHTTLLDSRDDVHFLFKSSPFGTQSHGHNPHNTFQLNAYGEALLTTCVYRDLHGSPFHYQWAHSTVAHNGVLVDGQGQAKHTAAPHGRIVEQQFSSGWDYLVGDATEAYGERLKRFRRHVLFVKPGGSHPLPMIVLYDELEAVEPSTFQFMLHALKLFDVEKETGRLSLELKKAGLQAQYFSPVPLKFRQWDGYKPAPRRALPNQFHLEAGTTEPVNKLEMLTLLVPYRAGRLIPWTAQRVDEKESLGVSLKAGRQTVEVAFRRAGVSGAAKWKGQEFDGPVLVK